MTRPTLSYFRETDIEDAYSEFRYSYRDERIYQRGIRTADLEERRRQFINLVGIPENFNILMLFNQINHFYAYQEARKQSNISLDGMLEINRLNLYLHDKEGGSKRKGLITYGQFTGLQRGDPRMGAKKYRGLPDKYLDQTVKNFFDGLNGTLQLDLSEDELFDVACFANLSIVAIHPLIDANHRYSRILFSQITANNAVMRMYPIEGKKGHEAFVYTKDDITHAATDWISNFKLRNPFSVRYSDYEECEVENGEDANRILNSRMRNIFENPQKIRTIEPLRNWADMFRDYVTTRPEDAVCLSEMLEKLN